MKCPNCGENMKGKLNFCGFCGTNLKTGEKPWTAPIPTERLGNIAEETEIPKRNAIENHTPNIRKNSNDINADALFESIPIKSTESNPEPSYEDVAEPTFETILKEPTPKKVEVEPPKDVTKTVEPPKSNEEPNLAETNVKNKINLMDILNKEILPKSKKEVSKELEPEKIEQPKSEINLATILQNASLNKAEKETPTTTEPIENQIETVSKEEVVVVDEQPDEVETPTPVVPTTVKMIDVTGQNKKSAKSKLEFKELNVSITYINDNIPNGTVLSQSIAVGEEVEIGSLVKLTVSVGTWTEWSDGQPALDNESNYIIESKKQYQSRTRSRIMDNIETNNLDDVDDDYTLYDTKKVYSNWLNDKYYTSDQKNADETCEIVSTLKGFKYSGWFYNGNKPDIKFSYSSPLVATFFHKDTNENEWIYKETIAPSDITPNPISWKPTNDDTFKTPAGDSIVNNIFVNTYNLNGTFYCMRFGNINTDWFIYKQRILQSTTYYFEKEIISEWSEWSEWSDEIINPTTDREVKTKVISRYRRKNSSEL